LLEFALEARQLPPTKGVALLALIAMVNEIKPDVIFRIEGVADENSTASG
jgi:hypothetical protein